MDEILYLEPDEEITSVVDKLKGLEANSVGLVAPKGSSIVQSLVSLKLLQKQAKEQGKEIAIITSDEVGQNLASRIDLPVYADVRSRKPIEPISQKIPEESGPIEITDEPAVETAELAEAKIPDKSVEKPVKQEELPEEYKDLPKSFEVHRYDQAKPEEAQEEAATTPIPSNDEDHQEGEQMDNNNSDDESDAKFVNRPLRERKVDNRMELESARPMIHEKKQISNPLKSKKSPRKVILTVVGVVLFLAAVLLADLALAKLEINMSIPAEEISKDVTITVEKDHPALDLENGIIGGTQVDKEILAEDNFTSSGEKETGEKAKGNLTAKNDAGVDEAIASGSTVRSSGGIEFTSDKEVTIPKASLNSAGDKVLGQATIPVTAKEAGTKGNLPSSTSYVISGKTKISITGETSGGSSKKIKIVAKSDIDSAKKALQEKAVTKFKDELKTDKKTLFIDDAIKADLIDFTTSKNIGDEADNFKATAKVKIVTITFLSEDFNQAVQKTAEKDLPAGKSLLITEADSVTPVLSENLINVGKLKIKGELRSHIGPKIELDKMIASFRGKPLKNIKAELEKIEGASINEVKISPDFALPLGPILKKNTHIKIEYTKK
jgi:hypothetical protein